MDFIDRKRSETWAAPALLATLRKVVGNKCWYTEAPLDGSDPNVDHFRPKGNVREVDRQLRSTGETAPGYWWLAFEYRNYRFTCAHANQRRVEQDSQGGKWDFFPVRGARALELTDWGVISEDFLALDPCSASDVALLWFDPYGVPGISPSRKKPITPEDRERVDATIWLYHLNMSDLTARRAEHLDEVRLDILKADASHKLWKEVPNPSPNAKESFDQKVAEIRQKIADDAPFAGAKRCAVRTAMATYEWIEEFQVI